ncbi:Bacterial extracellular solute-binding protein, family 3 [compost metagenome]
MIDLLTRFPYLVNVRQLLVLLLLIVCAAQSFAQAKKVLVGGYEWPPYVILHDNKTSGLTLDLIDLLNKRQDKYIFEFVLTSPTRRFQDITDGRYHVILFESKSWGWNPTQIEATKVFLSGSEVFVTSKENGKTQAYFDELKGKRIKGIHGYHYGFLGLSTAPKAAREYNLELTSTQDGNIQAVLNKRADIAVVPKEYLPLYFKNNPGSEKKLLISKKIDQVYQLGALLNPVKSPISASELSKLIEPLFKDGTWDKMLKERGLPPTTFLQEARPNNNSKLI